MTHHSDTSSEDIGTTARRTARKAAETARAQFGEAYDQVRDTAAETGETVVSVVMDLMDRRMNDAATGFRDMAAALHDATDEAGAAHFPRRIVDLTADAFDAMAGLMEDRSARDLIDDMSRLSRTSPTTFVLGSLVAGFAIGRLLTAEGEESLSGRAQAGDDAGDGFGAGPGGQTVDPDRNSYTPGAEV